LYSGAVDGAWGADSAAALERFQQSRGLQVNGQLNQATVVLLGLNPNDLLASGSPITPAQNALPPAVTGETLTPDAVRAIQNRLRQLGYYTGPNDGIWGPATQGAVQSFQQGQGLQPTGQLNPATVAVLGLDPNILVSRAR
jgi:peptidoglycan hydrolase-like protein with peptidoglycan-binding domain